MGRVWSCALTVLFAALLSLSTSAQEQIDVRERALIDYLHNPADSVLYAAADIATLPPDSRYLYRYLTHYNNPAKVRASDIKVDNGHFQHLNREPDLQPGYVVPGTDGTLVRVNLADYGWQKVFDKLADEDPYFHVGLVADGGKAQATVKDEILNWPGGVWPGDGKYYAPNSFTYTPAKAKDKAQAKDKARAPPRAIAPIFTETPAHTVALAKLVEYTKSQVPILRADWFFNQTAAAVDRVTNYYSFLGIKTQDDFEKLIGFDAKLAVNFTELRDAIAISGVTLQPRAVLRQPAIGGAYWRTFDFAIAKDDTDPLRIIGADIEKRHKATEAYGFNACGFWITGAFALDRKAQATVPDDVASDGRSRSNDRRIHPNISCVRCHDNGGLQELDQAWFRSLLESKLQFNFVDYNDARKFRQQYVRRLEPFILKDRTQFAEAVFAATGFGKVTDYTAAYTARWERYEDSKVDLGWAARDLGVSAKVLKDALMVRVVLNQADTVLAGIATGKSVPVKQWEQSYQLAYIEVRAFKGK